jgi:hypothetical protein
MKTAIRSAAAFARRQLMRAGTVYEVHIDDHRSVNLIGECDVGDFWEQWNHAIGDIDIAPDQLNRGRFLGVVHDDGAYLVALGSPREAMA